MLDVIEDVRNEFKVKLTDKFEEEVLLFFSFSSILWTSILPMALINFHFVLSQINHNYMSKLAVIYWQVLIIIL